MIFYWFVMLFCLLFDDKCIELTVADVFVYNSVVDFMILFKSNLLLQLCIFDIIREMLCWFISF